jgi:uncharacterized protein YbbK (DUF523 family)
MEDYPRPRLVVSRCLELAACRYNGATIRAPLVRRLEPYVELVPICPEVEVGLGVPATRCAWSLRATPPAAAGRSRGGSSGWCSRRAGATSPPP